VGISNVNTPVKEFFVKFKFYNEFKLLSFNYDNKLSPKFKYNNEFIIFPLNVSNLLFPPKFKFTWLFNVFIIKLDILLGNFTSVTLVILLELKFFIYVLERSKLFKFPKLFPINVTSFPADD
jgi:hypothetical protein